MFHFKDIVTSGKKNNLFLNRIEFKYNFLEVFEI